MIVLRRSSKRRRMVRMYRLDVLRLAVAAILLAFAGSVAGAQDRVVPRSLKEIQLSYAPLVQDVAPAVVNIYTQRVVATRRVNPLFDDPFFERFFGPAFPEMPRERIENSLGSGVIVSPDGVIVTNLHVIQGSDQITVALADRREFEATIVGADEATDLAVLRIDAGDGELPFLELGDSDAARVGDIVLAIGNPYGVGQTVTSGIISAQARTGVRGGAFIQTDAAINPGNSGGALITLNAKLIGINTVIVSRSGGSVGIGFAIPSNLVRVVVEGMVESGRVVRPWLGIEVQPVTADIARSIGQERPTGVLVNQVHPLSPARPAGLQIGDVIIAVDGYPVFDPDGLDFRLSTHRIGETAVLTMMRDADRSETVVPLIAPPETPPRDQRRLVGAHPLAGATVANLSPALAIELGLDTMRTGVIVLRVERGPASRLGVRPGDIIIEVAGQDVETTATLTDIIAERRAEWPIAIDRDGQILRVVVRG